MLLCDGRMYNRLVKQCGKTFSKKKVMPYPVNLKKFIQIKKEESPDSKSNLGGRKVHINDGMRIG